MAERDGWNLALYVPQICSLHVQSIIRYRYAHTVVRSDVLNTADIGQEVTFSITLPETAFISSFSIEVDGKTYDAKVKEKEEAKKEYERAVKQGRTAAHVAVNPRESNRFSVSVNVEAKKKIKFTLTYEELLNRKLGKYKHFINLEPGQIVEDFSVQINIEESTDITTLTVPAFKEISDSNDPSSSESADISTLATVLRPTPHSATIKFAPTPDQQRKLSTDGIKGQLAVLYDVDRSTFPSQLLVNDGYFAHFFAPDQLKPLPKYVVFVLDISGSMGGRKIEQLKQAMESILSELRPQDHFTILTFHTEVQVWRLVGDGEFSAASIQETNWKNLLIPATLENIIRAKLAIHKLAAGGGTDIYAAFMTATHIAQLRLPLQQAKSVVLEPLIIFLTDGQPTAGQTSVDEIINETTRWNQMGKAAIFSLGIGREVDFEFLKKLSLRNSGFARKIYDASDTALQLSNFYKEVSSPLLSNVTFIYQPEQVDTTSVTKSQFVTFFHGSELIVCGRVGQQLSEGDFCCSVSGNSSEGERQFDPKDTRIEFLQKPGFMERLWGYLTIQQLLEEGSKLDGEQAAEKKRQATQLALKFSFVTPVTSLVVVRPEDDQKPGNERTDVDLGDYDMLEDYDDEPSCDSLGISCYRTACLPSIKARRYAEFQGDSLQTWYFSRTDSDSSKEETMRIFPFDFFNPTEKENTYVCTICNNKITDNLRNHVLTSHPKLVESMVECDICNPDSALVLQQVTEAMINTKVSHQVEVRIQGVAGNCNYMIGTKVHQSVFYLKLDIVLKQSHFFLIINIKFVSIQNEAKTTLAIEEIPSDATPETLAQIVTTTLQYYGIEKKYILFFITDCINNSEICATEDNEEIEKIATKLIQGVQLSTGITGGWNPKKILNESVNDALKSVQPIIVKCERAVEENKISAVLENTELNAGLKDWHSTYNIINSLLASKQTLKLGISEEEWQEIAQIADVLKPLKTLGEKQHTLCDLYETWIDCAQDIKKIGTPFAESLSTSIHKRAVDECMLFAAMLFLNPRHKSLLNDHQVSLAMEQIMKIWECIMSSWGGIGINTNKEMQQLWRNYQNLAVEATKQSALQYWESQNEKQSILYKIASTALSIPTSKSSLDQICSNINIILSSLPDEVKKNIVRIRCLGWNRGY